MGAELAAALAQPAEVDDASHACVLRRPTEALRYRVLTRDPILALTDAVHEEHRCVDAGHRLGEVLGDVGAHHLNQIAPRRRVELPRGSGDAADLVAVGEQLRYQTSADVARCPRDQDAPNLRGRARRRRRAQVPLVSQRARSAPRSWLTARPQQSEISAIFEGP